MSVVDLEQFKKRVRVDFDDIDIDLEFLLDSAEETIIRSTNRGYGELESLNGGEFPKMLIQAIMMLAAHWVNQVEAVGNMALSEVPYSIQALVKPWRKLAEEESKTEGSDESGTDADEA